MFPDYFARMINSYGNFLEFIYVNYMNSIDSCLVFFNKNKEIYNHNKNQSLDSLRIYMEGYEKAKKDLGFTSTAKEPAECYF